MVGVFLFGGGFGGVMR
jgi:hypothetical protein